MPNWYQYNHQKPSNPTEPVLIYCVHLYPQLVDESTWSWTSRTGLKWLENSPINLKKISYWRNFTRGRWHQKWGTGNHADWCNLCIICGIQRGIISWDWETKCGKKQWLSWKQIKLSNCMFWKRHLFHSPVLNGLILRQTGSK